VRLFLFTIGLASLSLLTALRALKWLKPVESAERVYGYRVAQPVDGFASLSLLTVSLCSTCLRFRFAQPVYIASASLNFVVYGYRLFTLNRLLLCCHPK
jgi:hypothetical protein